MSSEETDAVIEKTRELKRLQETPDSPEALASIPVLRLSDLDKKNKTIPLVRFLIAREHRSCFMICSQTALSILIWVLICIPFRTNTSPMCRCLAGPLLKWEPSKEDFVSLMQRISRKTGGISPQSLISTTKKSDSSSCLAVPARQGHVVPGRGPD